MNEIYGIINAHLKRSINGIYARADQWYEVSYGVHHSSAYYRIIDGKIVDVQFD